MMSEAMAARIFMEEDPDEADASDVSELVALPTVDHGGPGPDLGSTSWFETPSPSFPSGLLPADTSAGWDPRRRPPWPPPSADRRHALLQVFLI
jgi:hypothetical protein